jgi:hypothetical protein
MSPPKTPQDSSMGRAMAALMNLMRGLTLGTYHEYE